MAESPRTNVKSSSRTTKFGFLSRVKMFLITCAAVFLVISFFWGEFGLVRMWFLTKKIEKIEKDIKILKVQRNDILWETDKMKNDPVYLQKYAVEKYGYARPEHKIVQFVHVDSTTAGRMKKTSQEVPRRRR